MEELPADSHLSRREQLCKYRYEERAASYQDVESLLFQLLIALGIVCFAVALPFGWADCMITSAPPFTDGQNSVIWQVSILFVSVCFLHLLPYVCPTSRRIQELFVKCTASCVLFAVLIATQLLEHH